MTYWSREGFCFHSAQWSNSAAWHRLFFINAMVALVLKWTVRLCLLSSPVMNMVWVGGALDHRVDKVRGQSQTARGSLMSTKVSHRVLEIVCRAVVSKLWPWMWPFASLYSVLGVLFLPLVLATILPTETNDGAPFRPLTPIMGHCSSHWP